MNRALLLKVKIKQDLKQAYDPDERVEAFSYMYKTENKKEYQHLLDAYNISEKFLKVVLYELRNPKKPIPDFLKIGLPDDLF